MIDKYTYLVLGIILGIALAIYFFMDREEKIEKEIKVNKKIYSTEKLDITMKNIVEEINKRIKNSKRELTEEEKNEIITECYKANF